MPKDAAKDDKDTMIKTQVTRVSRRAASTSTAAAAAGTIVTKTTKTTKTTTKAKGKAKVVSTTATTEVSSEISADLAATMEAQLPSLEVDTMGKSWYGALKGEFKKPYFVKLKSFLETEIKSNTVFPPLKDVYSWSRYTPLESVKVVIIGQDPYHNVGQAHGLSFSVLAPEKPPPSLKNIYKQIAEDFPSFVIPKTSGDLSKLAELGVLWLNSSLTVRAHNPASHSGKGWETLTGEALRAVISRENSNGVVFMAWGLPAQKTCAKLGIDETKHLVLKSAHPSPLSASRGFHGNGHFRLANEWLVEKYGEGAGIDWTVLGQ